LDTSHDTLSGKVGLQTWHFSLAETAFWHGVPDDETFLNQKLFLIEVKAFLILELLPAQCDRLTFIRGRIFVKLGQYSQTCK